MNSPVIKPTVGRVVWFYPSQNTSEAGFVRHADGGGPYAALIAHVWNDRMVNLSVFDANGAAHPRTSVTLHHGEGDVPSYPFCGWMPYQKGQAAKEDSAKLDAAKDGLKCSSERLASAWGMVGNAANISTAPRVPTHREDLERTLVGGIAHHIGNNPEKAKAIADGIKTLLDGLAPIVPQPAAIDALPVIDPGSDSLEREIQAKGLTAPRVTPADLHANMVHTEIVKHVSPSGQVLRWAVLTTRNGFAVTGRPSACVSSANDNAEIGERVAIDNAKQELWPLMGYALRDTLTRPVLTDGDAAADLAGTCRPDNHSSACTAFTACKTVA